VPCGRILSHSHDGLRRLRFFRKCTGNRQNLSFLADESEPEARAVPKDFKLSRHLEGLSLELWQRPPARLCPAFSSWKSLPHHFTFNFQHRTAVEMLLC
jgi:hypothetical protein